MNTGRFAPADGMRGRIKDMLPAGEARRGGTFRRNSAIETACPSDFGDARRKAFSTLFLRRYRNTSTLCAPAWKAPSFRRTRRRRAEKSGGRFAGDRAIQGGLGDQDIGAGRPLWAVRIASNFSGRGARRAQTWWGTMPPLEGVDFGATVGGKAFDADSYVQKQG